MWSQRRRELRRLEGGGREDFVEDYQEAKWEMPEYV